MVKYVKASMGTIGSVWQSDVSGEYYRIVDSEIFPGTESYRFVNINDSTDVWVGLYPDKAGIDYLLSIFPEVDRRGRVIDEDYLFDVLPTDVMRDENGNLDSFIATVEDFSGDIALIS